MLLQVNNLRTRLIGPVELSLDTGECIALLGASGSGKSLLLRAITDIDPNEADIRLDGRDRNSFPADEWRRNVALVPAESGWWGDRVGDHFEDNETVGPLLEHIGLPQALDWQVARLSTGERHRLAIARALVLKPRVLLLDEPTAALDEPATERIESLMHQQISHGVAILLVTHDRRQAGRMAIRSHIIEKGRFVKQEQAAS